MFRNSCSHHGGRSGRFTRGSEHKHLARSGVTERRGRPSARRDTRMKRGGIGVFSWGQLVVLHSVVIVVSCSNFTMKKGPTPEKMIYTCRADEVCVVNHATAKQQFPDTLLGIGTAHLRPCLAVVGTNGTHSFAFHLTMNKINVEYQTGQLTVEHFQKTKTYKKLVAIWSFIKNNTGTGRTFQVWTVGSNNCLLKDYKNLLYPEDEMGKLAIMKRLVGILTLQDELSKRIREDLEINIEIKHNVEYYCNDSEDPNIYIGHATTLCRELIRKIEKDSRDKFKVELQEILESFVNDTESESIDDELRHTVFNAVDIILHFQLYNLSTGHIPLSSDPCLRATTGGFRSEYQNLPIEADFKKTTIRQLCPEERRFSRRSTTKKKKKKKQKEDMTSEHAWIGSRLSQLEQLHHSLNESKPEVVFEEDPRGGTII